MYYNVCASLERVQDVDPILLVCFGHKRQQVSTNNTYFAVLPIKQTFPVPRILPQQKKIEMNCKTTALPAIVVQICRCHKKSDSPLYGIINYIP